MIIAYGISNLFVDITTGFSMARKNINGLSTAVIATVLSLLANVAVAEELLYFVHNDHRGAPVAITDESQTIVWKADYKPFGEVELTTETVDFPLRLPGQYHDRESGYYYNYYRDYDPTLGRYIQSDPIGLKGGLNTYAYVDGNPLMYIDPYGLNPVTAEAGMVGGTFICGPACGVVGGLVGFGFGAWGANEFWNWYNNEDTSQNEKKPKNCPSGTQDIDKAKKKHGWDKDTLHGIKDAAHGGMGTGKSWTGVAPDGTVGINEGGEWSPQGHWEDLL